MTVAPFPKAIDVEIYSPHDWAMTQRALYSSTPHLASPGEVLAQLPGILGFFPQRSFLAVCFHNREESRYVLGAVLRVDLDERQNLADAVDKVQRTGADFVLGFVVAPPDPGTGGPEGWAAFAERLRPLLKDCGISLMGCWHTESIADGESYRLLEDTTQKGASSSPSPLRGWHEGAVSSVASALSHTTMALHGDLPELSREESISFFDRSVEFHHDEGVFRTHMANHCKDVYLMPHEEQQRFVRLALEEFSHLLQQVKTAQEDVKALMARASSLVPVAAYLSTRRTRDALLGETLRQPEPAMQVSLAIARCFDGVARANALCLYAAGAAATGRTYRAWPALIAAQNEVPGHTLSRLMQETISTTGVDCLLDCLRRGSKPDSAPS